MLALVFIVTVHILHKVCIDSLLTVRKKLIVFGRRDYLNQSCRSSCGEVRLNPQPCRPNTVDYIHTWNLKYEQFVFVCAELILEPHGAIYRRARGRLGRVGADCQV